MKKQYESNIEDHMVKVKEKRQSLEEFTRDQVYGIIGLADGHSKLAAWKQAYDVITDLEIGLSPVVWIDILEDDLIGETFDDRQERLDTVIKALPHSGGYPMRVNNRTFQPMLYVDGEWVGIEAIKDPEPDVVEQNKAAIEMEAQMEDTRRFLKDGEAMIAEVEEYMKKMDDELSYEEAMRGINDER